MNTLTLDTLERILPMLSSNDKATSNMGYIMLTNVDKNDIATRQLLLLCCMIKQVPVAMKKKIKRKLFNENNVNDIYVMFELQNAPRKVLDFLIRNKG